jgi:hypothetical protein
MTVQQPQSNRQLFDQKLPRASSSTAPHTSKRLSVFGSSNVVNNLSEADLGRDLGVPVRMIPTSDCKSLRDQVGLMAVFFIWSKAETLRQRESLRPFIFPIGAKTQ